MPKTEPTISRCQVPPEGWWCSREPGHDGPCAARIDPETDRAGGLWYGRWWGAMERVEALERELAHLRTPAPMLMTQEWLDKKVDADPVAEVEACTSGEAGEIIERLRHSAERLGARRSGQLSATANYGNAGRGHCDPCLEPAIAACSEAADLIAHLSATDTEAMRLLRLAKSQLDRVNRGGHWIGPSWRDETDMLLARIDALAKGCA